MDNLDEWLANLRSSRSLVLVEGRKDKEALTNLGVMNIKTVSQKPLYKTVEEVSESKETVVILTDLDNEGRKYYSCLSTTCKEKAAGATASFGNNFSRTQKSLR